MSEPTLSLTYSDIQREVAVFLGWSRTPSEWSAVKSNDFSYILKRGLRLFYFPPGDAETPRYEWTFLRSTGTITLSTGVSTYTLPDNFGGVILDRSVTYPTGNGNRSLLKIDESAIRKNQSVANTSGVPKYYAVRPKAMDSTSGQRWEMLVYPTPSSSVNSVNLIYRYISIPDTLTSVNKYPIGGSQYGEVILAAVLAAAEETIDDEAEGKKMKAFQGILSAAIRADKEQKENKRGGAA